MQLILFAYTFCLDFVHPTSRPSPSPPFVSFFQGRLAAHTLHADGGHPGGRHRRQLPADAGLPAAELLPQLEQRRNPRSRRRRSLQGASGSAARGPRFRTTWRSGFHLRQQRRNPPADAKGIGPAGPPPELPEGAAPPELQRPEPALHPGAQLRQSARGCRRGRGQRAAGQQRAGFERVRAAGDGGGGVGPGDATRRGRERGHGPGDGGRLLLLPLPEQGAGATAARTPRASSAVRRLPHARAQSERLETANGIGTEGRRYGGSEITGTRVQLVLS